MNLTQASGSDDEDQKETEHGKEKEKFIVEVELVGKSRGGISDGYPASSRRGRRKKADRSRVENLKAMLCITNEGKTKPKVMARA